MPLRARATASLTALSDLLLWGALIEPGTLLNKDGSLSAHYEHTVAITPDGPWILTEPEERMVGDEERLIRELAARI